MAFLPRLPPPIAAPNDQRRPGPHRLWHRPGPHRQNARHDAAAGLAIRPCPRREQGRAGLNLGASSGIGSGSVGSRHRRCSAAGRRSRGPRSGSGEPGWMHGQQRLRQHQVGRDFCACTLCAMHLPCTPCTALPACLPAFMRVKRDVVVQQVLHLPCFVHAPCAMHGQNWVGVRRGRRLRSGGPVALGGRPGSLPCFVQCAACVMRARTHARTHVGQARVG
jgi:hypothetical protein